MPIQTFWPYIDYSLKLTAKTRRGSGNMYRHQMETLAILLEYGFTNPALLKAALIHDIIEDGEVIGFNAINEIQAIDEDGTEVINLVKEVSQLVEKGIKEPKSDFLLRIMMHGSEQAKILKLADRISNLSSLPHAGDNDFIKNYINETEQYILPYAEEVNPAMAAELKKWIETTLITLQK